MGEVYRAMDSKLKREVALKVLPADVANDRERLAPGLGFLCEALAITPVP
jgi:serine/threonine protein kinase